MKFSVVNLGCKVNRVESDSYEKILAERGYVQVDLDADVVVVNTCTVTGVAEKKTRKAVRHALKQHPRAQVVVTGCAAAINPDMYADMSDRISVVGKAESFDYLQDKQAFAISGSHEWPEDGIITGEPSSRTRVGVKVQDGCDNACTYCIVHVARGKASSRPLDEVIEEVVSLAEAGVKEIVLSGINIGSYRWEKLALTEMLETLLDATAHICTEGEAPVRFRVSSIEPMDVSDSFVELMARSDGRICRHLHLPLQAGSSKVLREMARPYDAHDFKMLVDYLRAMVPDVSLSTDIICGFPGETEEDFQETLELARYCEFSKIHVFPYSLRAGTPAAKRSDQVPPLVRSERAARLRSLGDELRSLDYAKRAGTRELVLVEQSGRAMTESYYEIEVPDMLCRGSLVPFVLPGKPCASGSYED